MSEELKRMKLVKFLTFETPWNQDHLIHKYVYLGFLSQLFENSLQFILVTFTSSLGSFQITLPHPLPQLGVFHCLLKSMESSCAAPSPCS